MIFRPKTSQNFCLPLVCSNYLLSTVLDTVTYWAEKDMKLLLNRSMSHTTKIKKNTFFILDAGAIRYNRLALSSVDSCE